jgi:hypothetical protein
MRGKLSPVLWIIRDSASGTHEIFLADAMNQQAFAGEGAPQSPPA